MQVAKAGINYLMELIAAGGSSQELSAWVASCTGFHKANRTPCLLQTTEEAQSKFLEDIAFPKEPGLAFRSHLDPNVCRHVCLPVKQSCWRRRNHSCDTNRSLPAAGTVGAPINGATAIAAAHGFITKDRQTSAGVLK